MNARNYNHDRIDGLGVALREAAAALARAADVLTRDPSQDPPAVREADALLEFSRTASKGLNRVDASAAMRRHGVDPRRMGSWIRYGYIARKDDRRWLTKAGHTRARTILDAA